MHVMIRGLGIPVGADHTTQLARDLVWAQHMIHAPRVDGADWHAGEARSSGKLCKCHAARLLDRSYPDGAVGAAAREDHADCVRTEVFGDRSKQCIAGTWQVVGTRAHPYTAISDRQYGICAHHIHVVSLWHNIVARDD